MGGAQEPPLPTATRVETRSAAPFTTHLLPDPPKAHPPGTRRGAVGKALRGLRVVGARGFEPPTFRSRTERATRLRHAPKSEGGSCQNYRRESMVRAGSGRRIRRSATSATNSASVISRIGVRSGCSVSRRSPAGSRASTASWTTRPPLAVAARGQRGRAFGRRRRPGGQLCREGEGEAAAGVGDQRAVSAVRAERGREQQRPGVDVGAEAGLVAAGRGLGQRQRSRTGAACPSAPTR